VHAGTLILLIGAAAAVAVVHSVLPDHWVPLAVVARTQRWSLAKVAGIAGLAACGHVVVSLVLAGLIALVGLRFQREIDTQQGHIVGAVLVLTGLGFLIWGWLGRGRPHGHGDGHQYDGDRGHVDDHDAHDHDHPEGGEHDHAPASHESEPHEHDHAAVASREDPPDDHDHEHAHTEVVHAHPHSHEEFIESRRQILIQRSTERGLAARLATIAVPFGVAASPDLTLLPVALAASAYGSGAVITVLVVFAGLTMLTFVGLTVIATLAGYQVKGAWLEDHANTITSLVLIAIGVVAYFGF
jgi:ABC-type nickel/cobalt efflux system permease component RcnA